MKKLSLLVALLLVLGVSTPSFAADKVTVTRIDGDNRYETAVHVSRSLFKDRGCEFAVLASGENFPDGLTGGVFAASIQAPILLTPGDHLSESVLRELKRLEVKKVFILGGKETVRPGVEEALSEFKVERIAGDSRYETAALVARRLRHVSDRNDLVALANGQRFPDSLSAAGYLANKKLPLLLTESQFLPPPSRAFLEKFMIREALIVGGEESVSRKSLPEGLSTAGFFGDNRYDTSLMIALEGFANPRTAILVNGQGFADSLSSGPLSAHVNGPILLTDGKTLTPEIKSYIEDSYIDSVIVVGGENSISNELIESIRDPKIPLILPFKDPNHPRW